MILVAGQGEVKFSPAVQVILQRALQLRDRREQGEISDHGVAVLAEDWRRDWIVA